MGSYTTFEDLVQLTIYDFAEGAAENGHLSILDWILCLSTENPKLSEWMFTALRGACLGNCVESADWVAGHDTLHLNDVKTCKHMFAFCVEDKTQPSTDMAIWILSRTNGFFVSRFALKMAAFKGNITLMEYLFSNFPGVVSRLNEKALQIVRLAGILSMDKPCMQYLALKCVFDSLCPTYLHNWFVKWRILAGDYDVSKVDSWIVSTF